MKKKRVTVKDLYVLQGRRSLLASVSFELAESEILCVVGPKNSGQDFLLRAIMGDLRSQTAKGSVEIASDCQMGYVSESLQAVHSLTVFQNLSLILNFIGIHSQAQMGEAVESTLRMVKLWSEVKARLHEPVSELTRFEQLKLNLARTLILRPKVLLLDDPTSTLDPIDKNVYEKVIEGLKESMAVIWVTYDLEQAGRVSDQLLFLYHGKMIESGRSEDLFTTPTQLETENFLSRRYYV